MLGFILVTLLFILSFCILHKIQFKYKSIVKIILIILAIEVYVFNINSYRTILKNYDKKDSSNLNIEMKNMEYDEKTKAYIIRKNSNPSIILEGVDTEVATVKIEANVINADKVKYNISYTDKTSSEFRELPSKVLVNEMERSKYTTCYLSGESEKLKINFESDLEEDIYLKINEITINEKIPFNFSITRVMTLLMITVLIYGMFKWDLMKKPYKAENIKQELFLILTVVIFAIIVLWIAVTTPRMQEIYEEYVNALSQGEASLIEEPPKELTSLTNPYDYTLRKKADIEANDEYIWDATLYNNKYYVYFGALPFLLLPVPIKILTGSYLQLNYGVLIFNEITIISLVGLIKLLYKKYFKDLNFRYLILAIIGIISGSLIFWITRRPHIYEFVLSAGIAFSTLGIYFMFKACEKEKIRYKYMCLAATCLALSVACRPNCLFASLIFIPLCIKTLINNIKEKRNILKLILLVGLPYVVVGISLMIFNYVRFDNIFEFGMNYQLTVNDVRNYAHRIFAIPVGIFTQLFELPVTTNEFPFFTYQYDVMPFFGYYYKEAMVCGLFILNPINYILIFLIGLKKKVKEKQAYNCALLFTIVGFIISIFNVMKAGSLQRYSMDFAWMLNIASYLTLFLIVSNIKSKEIKKYILKISIGVTIFMLFVNFIVGGVCGENNLLEKIYPQEFYNIRYDICFWE